MTDTTSCPKCGARLPTSAPAGICPTCLLQAGLASDPKPTASTTGLTPPALQDLAKCSPQLEILALIGHGGIGAVYKARQRGLDRLVALKILPPEIGHDPAFAERFTREAQALG